MDIKIIRRDGGGGRKGWKAHEVRLIRAIQYPYKYWRLQEVWISKN